MAFTFPLNPTANQIAITPLGQRYMFLSQNEGWRAIGIAKSGAETAGVTVSSTMFFIGSPVDLSFSTASDLPSTGVNPPFSFTISSGQLPTGLTLNAGVLSGTPSIANENYSFMVSVIDSIGYLVNTIVFNGRVSDLVTAPYLTGSLAAELMTSETFSASVADAALATAATALAAATDPAVISATLAGLSSSQLRPLGAALLGSGATISVGTAARALFTILSDNYNILDDGAQCDGKQFAATVTVSGNSLSTTSPHFAAGDIGKLIVIPGAGASGAPFTTTIAGFGNVWGITLASAAPTALAASAQTLTVGTDDTAAWTTALARGGIVRIPPGISCISSSLTTPTATSIWVQGSGKGISILMQTNMTADGIKFQNGGSGISMCTQISVRAAVGTSAGSSGVGLWLYQGNNNCGFEDCEVRSFDTCYRIDNSWNGRFFNLGGMYFQNAGIHIPAVTPWGGSNTFRSCYMTWSSSFTGSNASSVGFLIEASGGENFDDCQVTGTFNGFVVRPQASTAVSYLFFSNCLADTTQGDGWVFDGSLGPIVSTRGSQLWGSYTGGNGMRLLGANTTSGTQIRTGIDDFHVVNCDFRQNVQHGLLLDGGINTRFVNSIFALNSRTVHNVYDGISITGGVSNFAFLYCKSGNFSGSTAGNQRNGLVFNGSGGYTPTGQVIGCDLTGNVTNSMVIFVRTDNLVMAYNLPNIGISNKSQLNLTSGTTSGVVAAGSTVYLGQNGQSSNISDGVFVLSPAYIASATFSVDSAPGIGKSFTYQAYINGVAQGSPGVISDAGTVIYIPISQTVGQNVLLSFQIITSAGSAATRHRVTVQNIV